MQLKKLRVLISLALLSAHIKPPLYSKKTIRENKRIPKRKKNINSTALAGFSGCMSEYLLKIKK